MVLYNQKDLSLIILSRKTARPQEALTRLGFKAAVYIVLMFSRVGGRVNIFLEIVSLLRRTVSPNVLLAVNIIFMIERDKICNGFGNIQVDGVFLF